MNVDKLYGILVIAWIFLFQMVRHQCVKRRLGHLDQMGFKIIPTIEREHVSRRRDSDLTLVEHHLCYHGSIGIRWIAIQYNLYIASHRRHLEVSPRLIQAVRTIFHAIGIFYHHPRRQRYQVAIMGKTEGGTLAVVRYVILCRINNVGQQAVGIVDMQTTALGLGGIKDVKIIIRYLPEVKKLLRGEYLVERCPLLGILQIRSSPIQPPHQFRGINLLLHIFFIAE